MLSPIANFVLPSEIWFWFAGCNQNSAPIWCFRNAIALKRILAVRECLPLTQNDSWQSDGFYLLEGKLFYATYIFLMAFVHMCITYFYAWWVVIWSLILLLCQRSLQLKSDFTWLDPIDGLFNLLTNKHNNYLVYSFLAENIAMNRWMRTTLISLFLRVKNVLIY